MATIRKTASRRNTTKRALEPTPRHLWLASLGLLVAARREGKATAGRAAAKVGAAATGVQKAVRQAEASLHDLRGQVQPRAAKFSHDVEARLAPVLDKLGLGKPAPRRATRKAPARRKPATRARKVAR